jgi:hypothetical protein
MRGFALPLLISIVGSGCFDGTGRYASYQNEQGGAPPDRRSRGNDPAVRRRPPHGQEDCPTSYKVGDDRYINAEPYMSSLQYDFSETVAGAAIEGYFRRVMGARGWACKLQPPIPGIPYAFHCRHGQQTVNILIADRGHYELDVWTRTQHAPIRTLPGD